jgi:hypothetical protein
VLITELLTPKIIKYRALSSALQNRKDFRAHSTCQLTCGDHMAHAFSNVPMGSQNRVLKCPDRVDTTTCVHGSTTSLLITNRTAGMTSLNKATTDLLRSP